jgi:hypothetical protein
MNRFQNYNWQKHCVDTLILLNVLSLRTDFNRYERFYLHYLSQTARCSFIIEDIHDYQPEPYFVWNGNSVDIL